MSSLSPKNSSPTVSNSVRRVEAIRAEYERQRIQGQRASSIIIDLAYRYYLKESTIEAIIWKKGHYKDTEAASTV